MIGRLFIPNWFYPSCTESTNETLRGVCDRPGTFGAAVAFTQLSGFGPLYALASLAVAYGPFVEDLLPPLCGGRGGSAGAHL